MVDSHVLPSTHRCALYTPGHRVHFIQARLAWQNPQDDCTAEFLGIEDDVIVVVTELGEVRRFRNHDLDRLVGVLDLCGPRVLLRRHGVLQTADGGGYMFCVKPDDGEPLDPCVDPDVVPSLPDDLTPDELARHLLNRAQHLGGMMIQLGQDGLNQDE